MVQLGSFILGYFTTSFFGSKLLITQLMSLIAFPPKKLAPPLHICPSITHTLTTRSLCVFCCLYYFNTAPTMPHKRAPQFRFFLVILLTTRAIDALATHRIIIPRNVFFDESIFPLHCCNLPMMPLTSFFMVMFLTSSFPLMQPLRAPPHRALVGASPSSAPPPAHHTRSTSDIHVPSRERHNLHASVNKHSPIPTSARPALKDPNWLDAMTA
jgi:hypothetical protein